MIRQGNQNSKVNVYTYVTEGTFDNYLYQLVEQKQKFISQIMTSRTSMRSMEDIDEKALSYGEIKALATGDTSLGLDAYGNITRINNLLDNIEAKIPDERNKLDTLNQQMETAKVEVQKDIVIA